ncbi:MAG TPA: 2-C-methyl-D-erythritol 4-phosphate cytidylyltransferase [Luteolibacter sp.]|nr:2-C-methyl-D-erythritol 4-phosphate cytidylyltransferase [Luteolibacter sp.]
MVSSIIVASGSSQRMGFDKLLAPLAGKSVLQRTIEAFIATPEIHSIVVVCPEERWVALAGAFGETKPLIRVDGGKHRQDSVARGLAAVPAGTHIVAVHDGARPLVSPEDIRRCVEAAQTHGAASLARRVTETLKRADAQDFCKEAVCRDQLWSMETPQAFDCSLLRKAYQAVAQARLQVTDEVSALHHIDVAVKFVESLHPNLKITTPADLSIAEAMLERKS